MKRLSVYLDTSVVSFLYADDEPELRDITIEFFESFLAKYDAAVSEVVLFEIGKAQDPELRKRLFDAIRRYKLSVIRLNPDEASEVFALAEHYLTQGVVPAGKREDALHLAIATIREYDVLLSWNFRHLANIRKQAVVNAANAQAGYLHPLNLLNPMEVMYEE